MLVKHDYYDNHGNLIISVEEDLEVPKEQTPGLSIWDELDAAYQEGVNTAYDQ